MGLCTNSGSRGGKVNNLGIWKATARVEFCEQLLPATPFLFFAKSFIYGSTTNYNRIQVERPAFPKCHPLFTRLSEGVLSQDSGDMGIAQSTSNIEALG